jgi:adenylosuccinate lyase
MKSVFDEENWLFKLLQVEAALAHAHAEVGNIPQADADNIANAVANKAVKLERVKQIESEIRHDLMSVVKALTEQSGESGKYVHLGATSYDIEDTGCWAELTVRQRFRLRSALRLPSTRLRSTDTWKDWTRWRRGYMSGR